MLTETSRQVPVDAEEGQPPLALTLRGDLTVFDAEALHETALALLPSGADVVVTCQDLVHFDAAVLQVLLVLQRELRSRGRSLRLAGVSRAMGELLELAGVKDSLAAQAALESAKRGR